MAARDVLIGIDGGGSSCRFALLAGGQRHEIVLGPANVRSDRDATLGTLRAGLAELGLLAGDLDGARLHAGLAGVLTEADARDVAAALPVVRARVTDDRPTTMRGALGASDGTVAAIGTGSFFGRQSGGVRRFAGGWGAVLGDEASGAWLGRKLLATTLHAVDGLGPGSPLTERLLERLGGPAGIVSFAGSARPADMAALAAGVVESREDPVAARLLGEGAAWILRAVRGIGWTPEEPLCLLGGLGPCYAPLLGVPVAPSRGSALDGALALAAEVP
jgi:glucosamine kinase